MSDTHAFGVRQSCQTPLTSDPPNVPMHNTNTAVLHRGVLALRAVLIPSIIAAGMVALLTACDSSGKGAMAMPSRLWSIDGDGEVGVHAAIEIPPDAIGMAAAAGEVWIIEPDGVIQVHPAKGIHRTIPLPGRPTTIEIDTKLGVWIGGRGASDDGLLWNIDPETASVVRTVHLPNTPESLAIAASASPPTVWVISPAVGTILQIDATSGGIVGSNYFGEDMSDIATDSSLAWVAFDQDQTIMPVPSLDLPSPFFHEGQKYSIPGADALAATEDTLWVLDAGGERVFPVDLLADHVGTPISVGSRPTTIGLDGAYLWVANNRSITRIDRTSHGRSTIAFSRPLSFIATTQGPRTMVWVLADGTA